MPVMIARGDSPGHGTSAVGEDAGAAGMKHGPVRDDKGPERRRFSRAQTAGRVFAAVTLLPALLAVAWLAPGAGLLLAGRLLPVPMLIISGTLAVALCYFAMRRLPAKWPRFGGAERGVPAGALFLMVVIAAGFGLWQALFRSGQVFTGSDPGAYLQYGYWIAAHGTARIPESAASFGGAPGLAFAPAGFTVSGSSVTPGFLPGLPLVLAGGSWLNGLSGALLMPAVLGGCALLSFGGLVGRLCGGWQAVAGELVLAACLPEVYTARTPLAEPLVQVLLFGGLCLFTDSLTVRSRGRGGLVLAGLGGVALGLTVLASAASLVVLLPALPVLAVLFAMQRPQALPFGLGLCAGAGLGIFAGLVLARSYLAGLSPQLHLILVCTAGFGVAWAFAAALSSPWARPRVRRVCAFNVRFPWFKGEQVVLPSLGGVAQWLALVLPVAVLVGLAERPYFQVVRGQTDPSMIAAVASLQRLEQLPVDGLRQYDESSLYWVMWYLGVPVVLLACAGAAVLGRRTVEAVLDGRSAVSWRAARLWVLPLLVIFWSVAAVLWDPSTVPWQPLGSHRLAAVVLPGLVLLAVQSSSWLRSRASLHGASRAAVGLVGTCCVLAMAIPPLVTTLNPGLAARPSVGRYSSGISKLLSRVRLHGVGAIATYGGSLAAMSSLCASIGPSASVLFASSSTAGTFGAAVLEFCGQPVAWVAPGSSPPPGGPTAVLEQAVRSIERAGRRPVLLGSSASSVSLAGGVPRLVVSLRTSGDSEDLTGPPSGTWPVTYSVWLTAPLGAAA